MSFEELPPPPPTLDLEAILGDDALGVTLGIPPAYSPHSSDEDRPPSAATL